MKKFEVGDVIDDCFGTWLIVSKEEFESFKKINEHYRTSDIVYFKCLATLNPNTFKVGCYEWDSASKESYRDATLNTAYNAKKQFQKDLEDLLNEPT